MPNPAILTAVEGDDPCGADLAYSQEIFEYGRALENIRNEDAESVVEGELVAGNSLTPHDVIEMAEALSSKSKSISVIAPYVEASWMADGLPAFAEALEDMVTVAETWPGADDGVYPRADEEDGDLGMRAAPLGRLINNIPGLAHRIGWGGDVLLAQQLETDKLLRGVFEHWKERLEPAFGPDLPSCEQAWTSLFKLISGLSSGAGGETEQGGGDIPGVVQAATADAWDTLERATALMTEQDRHSPALPVLQLLVSWRPMGIVEIASSMKASGISLEQLLEAIKKNLASGN